MQIFVKTLQGQSYAIDVTPDYTLPQLKTQIFLRTGVAEATQGLVFNGKTLHHEDGDGMTLSDFDIQKDSVLFLTLRLSGGIQFFQK